jgi:hypothetical protein
MDASAQLMIYDLSMCLYHPACRHFTLSLICCGYRKYIKNRDLQRYWYRAILYVVFCLSPFVLKAQSGEVNPFSNIRTKTFPVTDTIRVDSLSLVPGSVRITDVPESDYVVLSERSLIYWKNKPARDSVMINYRRLAIAFDKQYAHKSPGLIDSNYVFLVYRPDRVANGSNGFVDFNQLEYNGSYGRSISLGNNQDVVLNSQFNLQVNGFILDSIKLTAAITDNTVPFQPEGNTQRLQEFDQIFINLQKGTHNLTLGDYNLEDPPSYFLNYYKRVQGIYYQDQFNLGKNATNKIGLSGSVAKGQFARNIFNGLEGNQGPYKLTGNNGEQFFIVLANTERVYINNIPMERGENADYIINYNTGEIRFMPRRMITKDSRIQVEFEYQDRNYLNSLIYGYDEVQIGKKLNMRFNAYSNQDAKNQGYLQSLDGAQKRFLATIGDSIQNALYPVIVTDTFAANKVLYRIVDTLVGNLLYDSVFVYSTDPNNAIYNLSFSFVGENRGDYIISTINANGRVYDWIAPIGGVRQGNYAPVQLLVTPKKQQVYTLTTTYNIDSLKTLSWEVAGSNADPNLFSKIDDQTHWGLASKLNYAEIRPFGKSDSLNRKNWKWENKVSYEFVQDKFQTIAPYRNVEFGRDWNVPQQGAKPDEHLVDVLTKVGSAKTGITGYGFSMYRRGVEYEGYRNIGSYDYAYKQVKGGVLMNILNANDTSREFQFLRPIAYAEYTFRKLMNTALGARYELEHNAITSKAQDTLLPSAFSFDVSTLYIKNAGAQTINYGLTYMQRRDRMVRNNQFNNQSYSHNVEFKSTITKWKNHQLGFTGTYRKLIIEDTTFTTQKPEESLLGRLEYNGNIAKGLFTINTMYEFGSGQEQKRSYTYVEVPAGQGMYTWNDYNNDGVQQANEFEVAVYADQKRFIRVFTPTNDYVKVNYINYNQALTIDPSNLFKGKDVKKWQKFISRFSDQLALQVGNRLLSAAGYDVYNPFLKTDDDVNIIFTNNALTNTFFFNRTSSKWGLDYNYFSSNGKQLLNFGIENNSSAQHTERLRWNISKSFTFVTAQKSGYKRFTSPFTDNRSYHVDEWSTEPSLTWLNRSVLRVITSYKFEERRNKAFYGGQFAKIQTINLEFRFSKPATGAIQLKGAYSNIYYNGAANTSVSFIMLDALQKGDNYIWGMTWDRKVGKGIEVSLEYEGRKPGVNPIIHTGRMSLRAIL